MKPEIYLLVCEGPTDTFVIKEIAKKISDQTGKKIQINLLSPKRDATTKKFPPHGWEEVRAWCDHYGNKPINPADKSLFAHLARTKHWRNQVAFVNAKGLIIHIDTDIAHLIYGLPTKFTSGSLVARKRFCTQAILNWLREPTLPKEMHFVLATYSTETWLLATYDRVNTVFGDLPATFNFEEVVDPGERLIILGRQTYTDPATGRIRLNKHESVYKGYAKEIANNLTKVQSECDEVDSLCKRFSK